MHKSAGFLFGLDTHHIDHLAPFCSLINVPLILNNEVTLSLAQEYYTNLCIDSFTDILYAESILKNFDAIFTCLGKALIDPIFYFDEHRLKKKILSIWLPHGNSDKDHLEALNGEKIILSYGKQMSDILTKKDVLAKVYQKINVGNYRAFYFEKHKKFYDKLLKKELSFNNKNEIVLYAPTWNEPNWDKDLKTVIKNKPDGINLLIKLHPNTLSKPLATAIKIEHEEDDSIKFIDHIPTIYPILDKCDYLITDHSSIAYDFLYFQKPIYFITNRKTPIHHSGYVTSADDVYSGMKKKDVFKDARQTMYDYAFDKSVNFELLEKIIKTTIDIYFENELHFL
jgi:CDP-glycerol glycerophosphotransferase (TagB/SpsB family)